MLCYREWLKELIMLANKSCKHGHIYRLLARDTLEERKLKEHNVTDLKKKSDMFDLWKSKSNYLIHEYKWTFLTKLKGFPGGVPEIMRSQGKKKICEVTATLTFHRKSQINQSLSPTKRLKKCPSLSFWVIVITRMGRTDNMKTSCNKKLVSRTRVCNG